MMANLLIYISLFIIWVMLFYHGFLMLGGYFHLLKFKTFKWKFLMRTDKYPTVSILIPAHNEELVIENTLQAMLRLNYPQEKLEIIVINDNSSDQTGAIIDRYAQENSFIRIVLRNRRLPGKENQEH